jgi:hypothetical protein
MVYLPQRDIEVIDRASGTMTGNSAPILPTIQESKPKRKRRPWVYKSDFNRLQRKYNILAWIAALGWLAFIVTLKFAI